MRPIRQVSGSKEFRRYTEEDITLLKGVKELIDEGFTLRSSMERVKGEKRMFGEDEGEEWN